MGKSIKILAIGNSFSVDGMEYLWKKLYISAKVQRICFKEAPRT